MFIGGKNQCLGHRSARDLAFSLDPNTPDAYAGARSKKKDSGREGRSLGRFVGATCPKEGGAQYQQRFLLNYRGSSLKVSSGSVAYGLPDSYPAFFSQGPLTAS
jgi:hypothetical protein